MYSILCCLACIFCLSFVVGDTGTGSSTSSATGLSWTKGWLFSGVILALSYSISFVVSSKAFISSPKLVVCSFLWKSSFKLLFELSCKANTMHIVGWVSNKIINDSMDGIYPLYNPVHSRFNFTLPSLNSVPYWFQKFNSSINQFPLGSREGVFSPVLITCSKILKRLLQVEYR